MLERLKLTNFRKHEDLVLDFIAGLNVVRGQNEAGKSTLQESIGYALFGSKALRTTFADTVTWGRPESSLRVELTVRIAGRNLTFSRGKSGAEVIEGGNVIVTGQNEVSSFAAGLLGCDGTAATNLIIASQNAMRGSLEQGPKATAALIEKLADFDLFDVLIERIQERLVVGAPATFEARVREAEARLDAFAGAAKPDEVAHNAWLSEHAQKTTETSTFITNVLRPEYRAAEKANENALQRIRQHDVAKDDLARAEKALQDHRTQRSEHDLLASNMRHEPHVVQAAKDDLAALEKAAGAADAHALFKTLPVCEHEFEGDNEKFAEWLDLRRKDLVAADNKALEKKGRIRELQAGIITSSTCGFCGQDVSAFPDVAKKNEAAQAEIGTLTEEIAALHGESQGITAEVQAGVAIEAVTRKIQQVLHKLGDYVQVDYSFTPPRVTWEGEVPRAVDLKPARELVAKLEREVALADQYAAKASALVQIIEEDATNVQRMKERLAATPMPDDIDTLYQAYLDAQRALNVAEGELGALREEGEKRRAEFTEAMAHYNASKGERERLQQAAASAKQDLEELAFNNTLLKKIRAARPIIADKLWNTVLAAVSTMFSQMRGEASVVSKDGDGFKVNGQPIEALSGSTLDILGLAIRTALVKTFIPHAAFMLLDEAAAACDEDRTGSLLGFVAGSGFEQVVLVTHESASEAVADKVIQL